MPTLIPETGAGLSTANTYVSLADATTFFAAHLYTTDWDALTEAQQQSALIMATRAIDHGWQFNGYKTNSAQALQWPRYGCRNPDTEGFLRVNFPQPEFDYDVVPQIVKDATCEMARFLAGEDRTTDPDGRGVKSVSVFEGVAVEFDMAKRQLIPDYVAEILSKVGRRIGGSSGQIKLSRA